MYIGLVAMVTIGNRAGIHMPCVLYVFSVSVSSIGSYQFRGLMLQARKVGSSRYSGDIPVSFFDPPDYWEGFKAMQCDHYSDTVTHSDNTTKNHQTFTWNAPYESAGNIEFRFPLNEYYLVCLQPPS